MEIRPIGTHELKRWLPMGRAFHSEFAEPYKDFAHPFKFLESVWLLRWSGLIHSGSGVILGMEKDGEPAGVIGGAVYRDLNDNALCAMESFWYVFPEQRGREGLRLITAFEDWARSKNVVRVAMGSLSHMEGETVGRIYEKRGYRPMDIIFVKSL